MHPLRSANEQLIPQSTAQQANAELSSQRASLDLAMIQLDRTKVTAPSDGVVGISGVREGAQVLSVVPMSELYVTANFRETQLAQFRPGQAVSVRVALPNLRALIGVGAVLLGTLTSLLNARLLDIGLADIRGSLGVGMDEASWLTTAYVVAEVAAIPSAVWLRSILSPTRGVLIGSLIFTVTSFLAPFSPNLETLIGMQAVRGLGAGILMPMAYAVVMRHMPQPLRLYGLAFYALVSSLTPSIAASVAGWVMLHLSWEYLLWINVIPGSLTLLAGA